MSNKMIKLILLIIDLDILKIFKKRSIGFENEKIFIKLMKFFFR